MKSILRRAAIPALVITALVVAATTAIAGTTKKPGPLAGLIAKSKTESGIVVYGNPPAANFNALVGKFKYYYPWINVTEFDLDDNTIFSKYASEAAQGTRTADMLIASAPNLWVYAARHGLAATDFEPLGLDKYPGWVKQYKGIYVMSPDPGVLFWNKLLLNKAPTSIADLASDSGTYSKLTGYTVDNTFGYTALYGYVQLKGWANLQKLGGRVKPTTGVGSQIQLVSQGAAVASFLSSPTVRFRIATDSNLAKILDWGYSTDGTPIVPRGIAVTPKASSPASARLFLNFVYSKAGQQAMCDAGFTAFMNGFKPGNGCTNTLADVYAKVGQKNVYIPGFTQKFVNARPAFAKQWHSIFG